MSRSDLIGDQQISDLGRASLFRVFIFLWDNGALAEVQGG